MGGVVLNRDGAHLVGKAGEHGAVHVERVHTSGHKLAGVVGGEQRRRGIAREVGKLGHVGLDAVVEGLGGIGEALAAARRHERAGKRAAGKDGRHSAHLLG